MSTRDPAAEVAMTKRAAPGAGVLCLMPAVIVSVLPGWMLELLQASAAKRLRIRARSDEPTFGA